MPQLHLPLFPQGVTQISDSLSFLRDGDNITYYHYDLPVFTHAENDLATFRMVTSQFCVNGHVTQAQISRIFGVPLVTVKRAVKRFRDEGVKGFYAKRNTRGAAVLTEPVLIEAQRLLDDGRSVKEVAAQLELKSDTLGKAVRAGRLHEFKKKALIVETGSKSERSELDAVTPTGVATHNVKARLAASVGALGAVLPQFEPAFDVPRGGVLCALPALLAMGLLEGAEERLSFQEGYYALDSLLILLAFMVLCRMETVEELRDHAPGEWGRLLGLDRAPEVRTLRGKIHEISQNGNPKEWSAFLCQRWMESGPEQAAALYIDGHVRVYHGEQTALPKHYVAREKLCLRATVDYWVNAMDGQPFIVFNQVVDHGLIKAIEEDILPSLELLHPAFKDPAPKAHRLTIITDREAYSPDFSKRMLNKKIACMTYRKKVTDVWPEEEFSAQQVPLVSGQIVTQKLGLARRVSSQQIMGARNSQTERTRPSNRHNCNGLPNRSAHVGRSDVRQMVSRKLLSLCPAELRPGQAGGLQHGRDH